MRQWTKTLAATVTLALILGQWAKAQVLDQVPQGALMVVKFNKLSDTSKKVAEFIKASGLEGKVPQEMGDPIGALQEKVGVQQGLDLTGDAAIVMLDPKLTPGVREAVLALIPIKDFAAFTSNFADAKADGNVTTFTNKEGQTMYAVARGKYAAIADKKEILAIPAAGLKTAAIAARELSNKDIVLFANFAQMRDQLLQEIEKGRKEVSREMDAQAGAGEANDPGNGPGLRRARRGGPPMPFSGPIGKAAVNQAFNALATFVKETDGASVGLTISAQGVSATVLGEFQPATYIGSFISKIKSTNASMLKGLPEGSYIFYGGLSLDGPAMAQVMDDIVKPIQAELAKDEKAKELAPLIDSMKKLVASMKDGSFAVLAPNGALGQSALIQYVGINHGDVATIKAVSKEIMSHQDLFSTLAGPGMPVMKYEFTENAKTIDGVALDQVVGTMAAGPNATPEQMQMQQMMAFMYGPNGMVQLTGALDANTMIMASGVDDTNVSALIASAKAGTDALGAKANVVEVKNMLPKQRFGEFYFAVDTLAKTALNYAAMFGFGMQINIPDDLPPVGISLATEGSSMIADVHVSSKLVKAISDAVEQGQAQMMGGPGGMPPRQRQRQRQRPQGGDGL